MSGHVESVWCIPEHTELGPVENHLGEIRNPSEIEIDAHARRRLLLEREPRAVAGHARVVLDPRLVSLRPVVEPREQNLSRPSPLAVEFDAPGAVYRRGCRERYRDIPPPTRSGFQPVVSRFPDQPMREIHSTYLVSIGLCFPNHRTRKHVIELTQGRHLDCERAPVFPAAASIQGRSRAWSCLHEDTVEK